MFSKLLHNLFSCRHETVIFRLTSVQLAAIAKNMLRLDENIPKMIIASPKCGVRIIFELGQGTGTAEEIYC